MLDLLFICILAIVLDFLSGAFTKYKEDKLKSKLDKILSSCSIDDILKGKVPVDILHPNTSLAHYVYAPYKVAFSKAIRGNDFKECEWLLRDGFLKNMAEHFSDREYSLLKNNENIKNHLRVGLQKFIFN